MKKKLLLLGALVSLLILTACPTDSGDSEPAIGADHPAYDKEVQELSWVYWTHAEFPADSDELWFTTDISDSRFEVYWFENGGGKMADVAISVYNIAGDLLETEDLDGNIIGSAENLSTAPSGLISNNREKAYIKVVREGTSTADSFFIACQRGYSSLDDDGLKIPSVNAYDLESGADGNELDQDRDIWIWRTSEHYAASDYTTFIFVDKDSGPESLLPAGTHALTADIKVTVMDDLDTMISEDVSMSEADSSGKLGRGTEGGFDYFIVELKNENSNGTFWLCYK